MSIKIDSFCQHILLQTIALSRKMLTHARDIFCPRLNLTVVPVFHYVGKHFFSPFTLGRDEKIRFDFRKWKTHSMPMGKSLKITGATRFQFGEFLLF